jgi:hypothetical protein
MDRQSASRTEVNKIDAETMVCCKNLKTYLKCNLGAEHGSGGGQSSTGQAYTNLISPGSQGNLDARGSEAGDDLVLLRGARWRE